MNERQSFYVTFGQRFRLEPHPVFPDAHPDGWARIIARSYDEARNIALACLGNEWSALYEDAEMAIEKHNFPRGEILVINRAA